MATKNPAKLATTTRPDRSLLIAGETLLLATDAADRLKDFLLHGDVDMAFGSTAREGSAPPEMTMTEDGLAVISAIGVFTRYDTYLSRVLAFLFGGIVSTDAVIDQFQAACDDPDCRGVLFLPDSPGGAAAAIHDLGEMIYQMRDVKPVVTYVDNMAASAGFWPAAAANLMVVSPASFTGCIGVVTSVRKGSSDDDIMEIVSKQSPKKRPDLNTEEGRAVVQDRADALAGVFIDAIAKYRGVDPAVVESDFGQGGVLIGAAAVAAGMADMLGDSNDAFAALRELAQTSSGQTRYGPLQPNASKGADMAEAITTVEQMTAAYPDLVAQVVATSKAEGAEAERTRIKAIDAVDNTHNRAIAGDLISAAKWDGKTTPEALSYQILQKANDKNAAVAVGRQEDAAAIPAVQDAPQGAPTDQAAEQAAAKAMADIVNERRGHPRR